ncbi:diguanylate cyclase [Nitratifractor sp.]|uniref:sensor domain-containing diguanylate cyclase n=1 Tax=Nitratifractor sp. TaxID=2268144 RepID=UPI0025E97EB8|nr:diguanylate cyclase [Nitratifractor sp.]
MREFYRYALFLALLYFAALFLVYQDRVTGYETIKAEHLSISREHIQSAQRIFDKLSLNFYNAWNDYLSRMLHMSRSSEPGLKRAIREELLSRLGPAYRNATLLGLIQFQLHDREGDSFLRFNHPDIYGDNLKKIRYSIREISKNHLFLKGFEAGRYIDGLRYIYPLFYDGEYVGSYEWVWDHETLIRELQKTYGGNYGIVVRRSVLLPLLGKRNFAAAYRSVSDCPAFAYQKKAYPLYKDYIASLLKDTGEIEQLCSDWEKKKDKAELFEKNGIHYVLSSLLIRDIAGKPYGIFLSVQRENRFAEVNRIFRIKILFFTFAFLLLLWILYRIHYEKIFVRTLLDSQKDLILLSNGKQLFDANRAFLEFFGIENAEKFIREHRCICDLFIQTEEGRLQSEKNGRDWLQQILQNPEKKHRTIFRDRRSGANRIFSVTVSRFDRRNRYVVIFRDVTTEEREKEHIKSEALRDHLTGIYNKRAFEHYLDGRLRDFRYYHHSTVVIIMFDIDLFKEINDRYGHHWGDEILKKVCNIVSGRIRKSDFFARWGGDEFMIVMDGITPEGARHLIEKLREEIAAYDFRLKRQVSCSFGITALHDDDNVVTVLDRVDKALYDAKQAGRNRVALRR